MDVNENPTGPEISQTPSGADAVVEHYDSLETRYERLRQAYATLLAHHEELDEKIRTLHDMHIVTDADGTILQANHAASLISPTHRLVGSYLTEWVQASDFEAFRELFDRAVKKGVNSSEAIELHLRRDAPYAPSLAVSVQSLSIVEDNAVSIVHWVFRPTHPEAAQALDPQVTVFEFERASQCSFVTNANGVILRVNPAFTRVTGYSAEEAVGHNPRFLQSGLQDKAFYEDFWRELQVAGAWQGLLFNRRKNGEIYAEWANVTSSTDPVSGALVYKAVFHDVSQIATAGMKRVQTNEPPNVYRTEPPPEEAA